MRKLSIVRNRKTKKWGVMNKVLDSVFIPFFYEKIKKKSTLNNTLLVKINNKIGVINLSNEIILPIEYDAISGWCEGVSIGDYVRKNGKTGMVDKDGKVIIPTDYDYLYYLSNGWGLYYNYPHNYIKAYKNGKFGLINLKNETIIPFEYDFLFSNYKTILTGQKQT